MGKKRRRANEDIQECLKRSTVPDICAACRKKRQLCADVPAVDESARCMAPSRKRCKHPWLLLAYQVKASVRVRPRGLDYTTLLVNVISIET